MKFKFLDLEKNSFIEYIKQQGHLYYLHVCREGKIIGVSFEDDCQIPAIHLDYLNVLVYRYTEINDVDGKEIYEGDKVELSEFSIFTNSYSKTEWTVKFKAGHWTINRFNESQDLFYVSHKVRLITDR